MINCYHGMWSKRSAILALITKLMSYKVPCKWTDQHQKAFYLVKKEISRETLLFYPNFNQPFNIHTDARNLQLCTDISQKGKPIEFYSRKLSKAQTRYTTTRKNSYS